MKRYIKSNSEEWTLEKFIKAYGQRNHVLKRMYGESWEKVDQYVDEGVLVTDFMWDDPFGEYHIDATEYLTPNALDGGYDDYWYTAEIYKLSDDRSWERSSSNVKYFIEDIEKSMGTISDRPFK